MIQFNFDEDKGLVEMVRAVLETNSFVSVPKKITVVVSDIEDE